MIPCIQVERKSKPNGNQADHLTEVKKMGWIKGSRQEEEYKEGNPNRIRVTCEDTGMDTNSCGMVRGELVGKIYGMVWVCEQTGSRWEPPPTYIVFTKSKRYIYVDSYTPWEKTLGSQVWSQEW